MMVTLNFWLLRVMELVTRFVIGPMGIIGGIVGIWLAFVLTDEAGETDPWGLIVPSLLLLLSSVFILVASNTRRGRERWRQYELGEDGED
ncbi:hypothetical protein ACH0CG_06435 [Microbacterium sp. 179-I 1D1 NHS]|uniref:hypothetical protein n=1 Tax=Microbacterium sp. 179-I 1D1 NHS TaxID=3374298 RepID=UPI003879D070